MSDEWGPWIEHDGRGCPCVGMFVEAEQLVLGVSAFIAGAELLERGLAPNSHPRSAWAWMDNGFPTPGDIIRYRIRKPRALEQLREIARNPERELEDA